MTIQRRSRRVDPLDVDYNPKQDARSLRKIPPPHRGIIEEDTPIPDWALEDPFGDWFSENREELFKFLHNESPRVTRNLPLEDSFQLSEAVLDFARFLWDLGHFTGISQGENAPLW